jgi:hypothetical protein
MLQHHCQSLCLRRFFQRRSQYSLKPTPLSSRSLLLTGVSLLLPVTSPYPLTSRRRKSRVLP